MRDLEQVLTELEMEGQLLAKNGAGFSVDRIRGFVRDVRAASSDLLEFMDEADAMLRSGHSAQWFRARFAAWEADGYARRNPRNKPERQYMRAVVPQRNRRLDAARDAGRAAAASAQARAGGRFTAEPPSSRPRLRD